METERSGRLPVHKEMQTGRPMDCQPTAESSASRKNSVFPLPSARKNSYVLSGAEDILAQPTAGRPKAGRPEAARVAQVGKAD
jgi:hypothetical protein